MEASFPEKQWLCALENPNKGAGKQSSDYPPHPVSGVEQTVAAD